MSNKSEPEFLKAIREILGPHGGQFLGDDAAIVPPVKGDMLLCQDLFVEGTHFLRDWLTPAEIAYKSIAVNLSDIASMNGRPHYAMISIAAPAWVDLDWIESFYREATELCKKWHFSIVGGDLSSADRLTIDVSLVGNSPSPLRLNTAQPGDFLAVTGTLGDAAVGLHLLRSNRATNKNSTPMQKFLRPFMKFELLQEIIDFAEVTACTDISDGLDKELRNMSHQSGLQLKIDESKIPIHQETVQIAREEGIDLDHEKLHGGEDYELLLAIKNPIEHPSLTFIGRVT